MSRASATLGKLETIEGASFYIIIKKLEILKAELVTHISVDWRDWSFSKLLEALRKWTETNVFIKTEKRNPRRPEISNGSLFSNVCVYCQSTDHKTTKCNVISSPETRKKYLADNKLCFIVPRGNTQPAAVKVKFPVKNVIIRPFA